MMISCRQHFIPIHLKLFICEETSHVVDRACVNIRSLTCKTRTHINFSYLQCVPVSTSNPSSNKIIFSRFVNLCWVKLALSAAWKATRAALYNVCQRLLPINLTRRGLHLFEDVILLSVMHMSCSNLAHYPNTRAVVTPRQPDPGDVFDPDRPVMVKK